MTKNNKQSQNKGKNKQTSRKVAVGRRGGSRAGVGGQDMASEWLELLRDPCTAKLARPCYTGSDAGYLIRTVDIWTPKVTGTFTAGNSTRDVAIQVCPYNFSNSSGARMANAFVGDTATFEEIGFQNFITNSGAVKRYRPVAACLKWVPTGIYSNRSGAVGLAYTAGQLYAEGDVMLSTDRAFAACQHTIGNGAAIHEVRWLPTQTDETFTSVLQSDNPTAACMQLVLKGVNCINSSTLSTLNGYVDVTVVWEWIPDVADNVAQQVSAPPPYSSQSVLARIRDMGSFLFHGALGAADAMGRIRNAMSPYVGVLSSGYGQNTFRGSGGMIMM